MCPTHVEWRRLLSRRSVGKNNSIALAVAGWRVGWTRWCRAAGGARARTRRTHARQRSRNPHACCTSRGTLRHLRRGVGTRHGLNEHAAHEPGQGAQPPAPANTHTTHPGQKGVKGISFWHRLNLSISRSVENRRQHPCSSIVMQYGPYISAGPKPGALHMHLGPLGSVKRLVENLTASRPVY
jgi:hypothetical protein